MTDDSDPRLHPVDRLCDAVREQKHAIFRPSELAKLKVSLSEFDPYNEAHLESNAFFFQPMPPEDLNRHQVNPLHVDLDDGRPKFEEYAPPLAVSTGPLEGRDRPYNRALFLKYYFEELLFCLPRTGTHKNKEVLGDMRHWEEIE